MKEKINLYTEIFFNENGTINRENSLVIDVGEVEKEKRTKPKPEILKQLRYIKNIRKKNKLNQEPIDSCDYIEFSIGEVLQKKCRGDNRTNQINQVIGLIKEMQKQRNYTGISKDYINRVLKDFCNLEKRTRERLLNQIINQSKSVKERQVIKKYLVGERHQEIKLKGEKTKSPRTSVNLILEERGNLVKFYSFID